MSKSSREKIEVDERKIISILKKEGNITIHALAEKTGMSRQAVWRHQKKMVKEKKICGYHIVVDRGKPPILKSTGKPGCLFIRYSHGKIYL